MIEIPLEVSLNPVYTSNTLRTWSSLLAKQTSVLPSRNKHKYSSRRAGIVAFVALYIHNRTNTGAITTI